MPNNEPFLNANTSYSELLTYAKAQNLDNAMVNRLVLGILEQNQHKTKRTFSYGVTLAASDAHCAPTFARSFMHLDWIDGESVVQAESTSVEEGFNSRFHKIERDFDAQKADVERLFACLAELRGELAARLEEIRTELNLINGDIADCCNSSVTPSIPVGPAFPIDPQFPPVFPRWPVVPFPIPQPTPIGPKGPQFLGQQFTFPVFTSMADYFRNFTLNPVYDPGNPVMPWMTNTTPMEIDQSNVIRSTANPEIAMVGGLNARRISTDTFNGKPVEVWSTPVGIVMTPVDPRLTKVEKTGWVNPHIDGAAAVSAWTIRNAERIEKAFHGQSFTVAQLAKAFGDERLEGGTRLSAWLDQLPSGATVDNAKHIGQMLIDRAQANVVRDGATDATVIGMIGLNTQGAIQDADVESIRSIPQGTVKTLKQLGVSTVGDLAKADTKKLADQLGDRASLESAAGWNTEARVLIGLAGKT